MELLEWYIALTKKAANSSEYDKNVISTYNRKLAKAELGITLDNLCRYISKFKSKGILVETKVEGEAVVNQALIPDIINDRVQLIVVLRINEDTES